MCPALPHPLSRTNHAYPTPDTHTHTHTDAVEVVMAVEEEFAIEIPDSEADKIWSVDDAVKYVAGHPMAK